MSELVGRYLAALGRQGASPLTIEAYGRVLREFAGEVDPASASREDVRAAVWRVATGQPRTVNRKLATIRSFYRWLVEDEQLRADNPVAGVRSVKVPKRRPVVLAEPVLAALRPPRAGSDTPLARRDYAVVATMLATGLRLAELCAVDLDAVAGDEIRVIGKGDKERVVFLDEPALAAIRRWLEVRDVFRPRTRALFVTYAGQRLGHEAVRRIIARTAGAAPHTLRRTMATRLAENGADLETVRILLGHESLATTQHYLGYDLKHVKETYRRARAGRRGE